MMPSLNYAFLTQVRPDETQAPDFSHSSRPGYTNEQMGLRSRSQIGSKTAIIGSLIGVTMRIPRLSPAPIYGELGKPNPLPSDLP